MDAWSFIILCCCVCLKIFIKSLKKKPFSKVQAYFKEGPRAVVVLEEGCLPVAVPSLS